MKIRYSIVLLCILFGAAENICTAQASHQPLFKNGSFAVYKDSVVQGLFTGNALSSKELASNYKSPANEFLSPGITFKFSINGKDNEMKSGIDHHFNCITTDGVCETPLIKFGQQSLDNRPVPDNTYLKPKTTLNIRVDMREVLDAMNKNGYYTTFSGDKIYKQDFKGVYVAGSTAPLSWDFDNLVNKSELKMDDKDGDGIYETRLMLNNPKDEKQTSSSWKASKDIAVFPQYNSGYALPDAVYNMAIEEMINAVEPDSTFRTGKEWAGVWTRDISYSIILSMAYLQPQVSKYSLMRKVNKKGRIIQDTGTGGAWPVSTDRMIWATAAWELYKATGDEDWLKQAYEIIKNSVEDDLKVARDAQTGLIKGESSFLDWREQTYPKWMQPVDIYESECLGTNAVHYHANIILYNMAKKLGDNDAADKYKAVAQTIKDGINKYLWMADKGYYGQFLYGRNSKILSPRSEALGEALSVLFDIADASKSKQIVSKTPVMAFGIPCIYPQIPNIPPYHNNAVWPFVQSYWAMAAAKAGNEEAVMESIAAIYRPAALWVTNKENFVASNGDFAGTQINSSNMLWSLSGNIALVHKILFGIHFDEGGLAFRPFVPTALQGKRSLANFRYRNAVLDIEMEGYGNEIQSFLLDGNASKPMIPATLTGRHQVRIVLVGNKPDNAKTNEVPHYVTLPEPIVTYTGNTLSWQNINGAVQYKVLNRGKEIAKTGKTFFQAGNDPYAEYQVIAVDAKGFESFASEPVLVAKKPVVNTYEVENAVSKSGLSYKGYTGDGFVEISKEKNRVINIPVSIPADGVYAVDFRYSNGNGPTNTENKCAIRTLHSGTKMLGTIVLPQRGKEEWSNWGWSNAVQATLKKGRQVITLSLEPFNENMNGDINQAMLDYIRIIRVK